MNKIDYSEIVNNVLSKYKTSPIDILNIGDEEGEYNYLISSADSYVRTIKDIDNNTRFNCNVFSMSKA